MKCPREQMKAELMKRIEKEIDGMLARRQGSGPPNSSQIEEEILKTHKGISQAMIERMISNCGTYHDRDHNAAINILNQARAWVARRYASGDRVSSDVQAVIVEAGSPGAFSAG